MDNYHIIKWMMMLIMKLVLLIQSTVYMIIIVICKHHKWYIIIRKYCLSRIIRIDNKINKTPSNHKRNIKSIIEMKWQNYHKERQKEILSIKMFIIMIQLGFQILRINQPDEEISSNSIYLIVILPNDDIIEINYMLLYDSLFELWI